MNNSTTDELISKATGIILQDGHTKADTKELSKLRYFLAIQYKKLNTDGSAKEGLYNGKRSADTVEKQNLGMAVGKAENEAKAGAEEAYGTYREINAEAAGIGKLLDTIEGFIITLQIEQKTIDQVYTGQ